MNEDGARLFGFLHENTDGFDPDNVPDELYDRLGVDSHEQLLARFNDALGQDIIVAVERDGRTQLYAQPLLEGVK